jgi:hypothetical protein
MAPNDNYMVLPSRLKWGLTLAVDTLLPHSKRIEKLFLCNVPCDQIDRKMNESICGSQTKLTRKKRDMPTRPLLYIFCAGF